MALTRTLAEWGVFFGADGKMLPVIELMAQTNKILEDILWIEGNQTDGHITSIRNGLPEVVFRRLYQGVKPSKSARSKVKDTCGQLAGLSEIDVDLLAMNGGSGEYRLSEAQSYLEAMNQALAIYLFYGDPKVNPDQFMGMAPRYPYKNSPNVIDAGGTGNTCTSMWFVAWGDNETHGIFPKGTKAGVQHVDRGEQMVTDAEGGKYASAIDDYKWNVGLSVRDWRCVVRGANIDVSKLALKPGEAGYVDLRALTIKIKNTMPEVKRAKGVWYCNQDIMTALEVQAGQPGNVHLRYGEYLDSKDILMLHGRPVRQCDAILSTEAALPAAP